MKSQWITTIPLIVVVTIFVLCSRDYNPFTDPTNAKAHVLTWPFHDSVPLYSTGRMKVVVAAREEVDSVVVTAEKNRFWPDTTIRRNFSTVPIDGGPYYFDISFYDTGLQNVSVKTYRSNGDMVPQDFPVRVYDPLHQAAINGFFGVATLLATPPVTDKDVFYQWDFGEGRIEKWPADTHSVVFPYNVFSSGKGSLQVTDLTGMHGTPLCYFSYSFTDTSAPVILCINDSVKGDTLRVADSLLAFKVYIADMGMGNNTVDSCSINQDTFDIVNNKTHVYIKVYKNLPALTAGNVPLRIVVVAIDNLQFNNKAQDTFWVMYDPAGIKSPDANIRIISPTQDPSYSALRTGRIVGTAENYRGDGMVMSIRVNDSLYPGTQAISGGTGSWQWPVYLDTIVNTVTVQARSSVDNRLLTYEQITVIYNPAVVDTIKPMIYEIVLPDGTPAGNAHLTQASTVLKIVAFDEGTGINSLTVNGAAAAQDTNGYCWYWSSGTLVHSGQGNRFSIEAQDRAGNRTDTAIVVFRNSLPELVADPGIPAELCIDSSYMFHLATYDADNDSVTIVKVSAPPAMAIAQNGTVFWKPTAADIGTLDSLVIQLSDQYEMTPRYCWKFTCRDCYQPLVPVHFATQEKDFPAFLQAGRDTLDIRLAIDTTQRPPYTPRYTARFIDNGNYILNNDTSGVLLWAPAVADTGYRRLLVIVGDGARGFDTLRPAIRVVPRNQYPCSLSYTFSGALMPDGELDLFSHPAPETLFFAIHDLDNILTEEYTVTIVRNNVATVENIKQRTFFAVVSPDSQQTRDTLRVFISDRTGTSDSARVAIRYTKPPPVKFQTAAKDFPTLLFEGRDSLSLQLRTVPGSGEAPFVFNAVFLDNNAIVLNNDTSGQLVWRPGDIDTGMRTLLARVKDYYNTADTIIAPFMVVPRNQYPCSLSYTFSGTRTVEGYLDLFSSAAPETLYFKINDRDNPLTERHTVTITRHGVPAVIDSCPANFIVALAPDSSVMFDTVRVHVVDLTGTADSVSLIVKYRPLPLPRRLYLNTTASGANVATNLLNFPVLVRLTYNNFNFSDAQADGGDIRFRKADGTPVSYEIERWDSAGGRAEIWVSADTVYGNDDSHFMDLYWVNRPATSASDPTAVFRTSVAWLPQGDWHMGENTGIIHDATGNHYDGTQYGNQTQCSGNIGMAQVFDGVKSYTEMGNVLNPGTNSFTVSAWIKRSAVNYYQTIIGKTTGGNPNSTYGWLFTINNSNYVQCYVASGGNAWGDAGTLDFASSMQLTDLTSWHHVAAVIDRSSSANCRIYIDGTDVTGPSLGNITNVGSLTNTFPLRIGIEADNQWNFNGAIDEVSVSFFPHTASWIKLCYMNQQPIDALVEFR